MTNSFLFVVTLLFYFSPVDAHQLYTIMLNPAGDAQRTGRVIQDAFERTITMQLCTYLKSELEKKERFRVILTRHPGETVEPLQNAQFANRLQVDLFISIHAYAHDELHMHLYHLLTHPVTDYWQQSRSDAIHMTPFDEAHKKQAHNSKEIAYQLFTILSEQQPLQFIVHQPIGFPFKPLVGIQAPAVGCEMSLPDKDRCLLYANKLIDAIHSLLEQKSYEE